MDVPIRRARELGDVLICTAETGIEGIAQGQKFVVVATPRNALLVDKQICGGTYLVTYEDELNDSSISSKTAIAVNQRTLEGKDFSVADHQEIEPPSGVSEYALVFIVR